MNYQTIDIAIDARGVAVLQLAREQKHNALNAQLLEELTRAAGELGGMREVRAVVLRARGKSFCAGADLQWMRANLQLPRAARIAESRKVSAMLCAFNALPKLLIARAHGAVYGGGAGLLAVCDIAIGARNARFCFSETRLGLAPANIAPAVIARIGARNARRCMLNAHVFDGAEAHALGLLDAAVPAAQLDDAVESEIAELLRCAPRAVATCKRLIARAGEMDTAALLAEMWEQDECREGIAAFFEKRDAGWVK